MLGQSPLALCRLVLGLGLLTHGIAPAVAQHCVPAAVEASTIGATVLGNGNPGSVSTTDIQLALNSGGTIVLDQGPLPSTIVLDSELVVSREAVIDGGGLVTLDGSGNHRIFLVNNPMNLTYKLTVQNLILRNAATADESGAAIYKPSGGPWQAVSLDVFGVTFQDNTAIAVDQDGGGGALYAVGMDRVAIADSIFINNRGSNGGAVYSLGSKTVAISGSRFTANQATGNSGNPGNGGNGGAIGIDGAERTVTLCDVTIEDSVANAFGAGFFTVMYDSQSLTRFDFVTFENNVNPSTTFGMAGGAYLQGGPFAIHQNSFLANRSRASGGLFLGPNANGTITNSTFHGNVATNSLAGGMAIDDSVQVSITNSTIAENQAPCSVCFAAGISNGAGNNITLKNTILANNVGGNEFNPWNIRFAVGDGGNNMQFPQQRPNGQAEPAATPTVLWQDPMLMPPADNGGPTWTQALATQSPAIGAGTVVGAPAVDQRNFPRGAAIDIGAYEWNIVFMDGFESGDAGGWSAVVP